MKLLYIEKGMLCKTLGEDWSINLYLMLDEVSYQVRIELTSVNDGYKKHLSVDQFNYELKNGIIVINQSSINLAERNPKSLS